MQYIFHLLWEGELRALSAGIFHTIRSKKFQHLSAAQFLRQLEEKEESLEVNLGTVFANVRGTRDYWFRRTSEALSMVREFGAPTWFVTLSCAEYYWRDMDDFLRKANPDVSDGESVTALCVSDPVSVMRQFENRFNAMLRFIKDAKPLGEVAHWFWRLEFQSRGAPHIHMLLWIKGAPSIGSSDPQDILRYIQEHVSCALPDVEQDPILNELVKKFQIHVCISYCTKRNRRCRF
jgi:hypothetical protein